MLIPSEMERNEEKKVYVKKDVHFSSMHEYKTKKKSHEYKILLNYFNNNKHLESLHSKSIRKKNQMHKKSKFISNLKKI